MPQTIHDLKLEIEEQKLKVLLNTSDSYRMFKSQQPENVEELLRQPAMPKKQKNQKYCKFDLFTDDQIGLGDIENVCDDIAVIAAD